MMKVPLSQWTSLELPKIIVERAPCKNQTSANIALISLRTIIISEVRVANGKKTCLENVLLGSIMADGFEGLHFLRTLQLKSRRRLFLHTQSCLQVLGEKEKEEIYLSNASCHVCHHL